MLFGKLPYPNVIENNDKICQLCMLFQELMTEEAAIADDRAQSKLLDLWKKVYCSALTEDASEHTYPLGLLKKYSVDGSQPSPDAFFQLVLLMLKMLRMKGPSAVGSCE
jgi:hypothetical protein